METYTRIFGNRVVMNSPNRAESSSNRAFTPQIVTKQEPNEAYSADLTVSAGFLDQNPTLRRLLLRTVGSIFGGYDPFSELLAGQAEPSHHRRAWAFPSRRPYLSLPVSSDPSQF
jgi:hypothetical protein